MEFMMMMLMLMLMLPELQSSRDARSRQAECLQHEVIVWVRRVCWDEENKALFLHSVCLLFTRLVTAVTCFS